jgi:hypothetical protein
MATTESACRRGSCFPLFSHRQRFDLSSIRTLMAAVGQPVQARVLAVRVDAAISKTFSAQSWNGAVAQSSDLGIRWRSRF